MKNTRSLLLNYFFLILCILSTIGCDKGDTSDRDHQVFRYNEQYQISTLDPAFARNPPIIWPVNHLFNGLVQLDNDLNVQPDIAKSWEISQDALT